MIVSCPTQRVHDSTSAPLGTLILDPARAIKERRAGADECKAGVCLTRGGAIGPVLSNERVHGEFGSIQSAMEVHFDRFETGRSRRVVRTC